MDARESSRSGRLGSHIGARSEVRPEPSLGDRTRRRVARNERKIRGATLLEKPSALVRPDGIRQRIRAVKPLPSSQKRGAPTPNEIGVGVIGLGFMGRTHIHAYAAAREAG